MSLRLLFALPFLLPPVVWAANPPQSAADWLSRMSQAAHRLNYEGTFIYEHEGRVETMQLYHGINGDDERDRLVTLDGAAREVVRREGKVTYIFPNHKAFVLEESGPTSPLPINIPTYLDRLESFYEPRVAGEDRIAGQAARKIEIAPRDDYRYGQILWLDQRHGLLLKVELRDEKNEVVEQLVFTSLKVHDGPLPERVLESQISTKEITVHPSDQGPSSAAPVESAWVVAKLPAGFFEKSRRTRHLPGVSVPVEHRMYTDGLASVSVFIEPNRTKKAPITARKGALNACTRFVDNYKVTVLGDVPSATVQLIADGVTAGKGDRRD